MTQHAPEGLQKWTLLPPWCVCTCLPAAQMKTRTVKFEAQAYSFAGRRMLDVVQANTPTIVTLGISMPWRLIWASSTQFP